MLVKEQTYETDVAVIGGGCSGIAAAIAAARIGANVIIVDRLGFLGGMATAALVSPMMTFHAKSGQIIDGIGQQLVDRLHEQGFSPGHVPDTIGFVPTVTPIDPEGFKLIAMEMVLEAGAKPLLHQLVVDVDSDNGKVKSVIAVGLTSLSRIKASVFIDCTGNARLVELGGGELACGREADSLTQPATMIFRVGNVDLHEIVDFIKANPEDFILGCAPKDLDAEQPLAVAGFFGKVREGVEHGVFHVDRDRLLLFSGVMPGEVVVNVTRVKVLDPADPVDITRAEIEGRRQVYDVFQFLKTRIPGFSAAQLIGTGCQIGIRETSRPVGDYILTQEDLLSGRDFADSVARGAFPIDIHSPDGKGLTALKLDRSYAIPYRCLRPKGLTNLLCAGRAISVTHEAYASTRVMPTCLATGQAAGTAAAIAIGREGDVRDIDIDVLRATLVRNGAILYEPS